MSKKNNDSIGGVRRADSLPRTLIGVNGVRLINIPCVYYPPHMLTEKTQRERHLPVILSKPPAWAISSRQAAEILGCKQSSTRELLHRERVRFCRVAEKGSVRNQKKREKDLHISRIQSNCPCGCMACLCTYVF